jgi:hypothetical protein
MNSLEFMGEMTPARLLVLHRSSQYLKEVIKCKIGVDDIAYLGIDI